MLLCFEFVFRLLETVVKAKLKLVTQRVHPRVIGIGINQRLELKKIQRPGVKILAHKCLSWISITQ